MFKSNFFYRYVYLVVAYIAAVNISYKQTKFSFRLFLFMTAVYAIRIPTFFIF